MPPMSRLMRLKEQPFVERRPLIVPGALDEDIRKPHFSQTYAQGGTVLFLFGPAADLLNEHGGIAAELSTPRSDLSEPAQPVCDWPLATRPSGPP